MGHSVKVTRVRTFDEVSVPSAPTGDRILVYETNFPSSFENDIPWSFVNNNWNGNTSPSGNVTQSFTTMNGDDAVAITWAAGSTTSDRWGGEFALPGTHAEGWFTVDMKWVSPWGYPKGFKLPGLRPVFFDPTANRTCTTGWTARHMNRPRLSGGNTSPIPVSQYWYDTVDDQRDERWDDTIPLDTVARVELYFRLNSAFNQSDGVFQSRWDLGTANTHANPETIRGSINNINWYCGNEQNRPPALINSVQCLLFFGGNDATWAPTTDCTLIISRMAFEIPAATDD